MGSYWLIKSILNEKVASFKKEQYETKVTKTHLYLDTLIQEKQDATKTIALSISKNKSIIKILKSRKMNKEELDLNEFSNDFKRNTKFKNVWFQLIDHQGNSFQRSWIEGNESLECSRNDIKEMLKAPKVISTISVDRFDLSFKTLVPIYDSNESFIGIFETITHFNSIANKIAQEGIHPIIIANAKYKQRLTHPFSKTFAGDYYLANLNAKASLVAHLQQEGIRKYINPIEGINYYNDPKNPYIISHYEIKNQQDNQVGYVLLFYPLKLFDVSIIDEIKSKSYIYLFLAISFWVIIFYLFNSAHFKLHLFKSLERWLYFFILVFIATTWAIFYLLKYDMENEIEFYKHQ